MHIELPILNRSNRKRSGFTLVESLAALLFLAIVLPVALQGLALANRSAVVAERKQIATRLLDNLINEWSATGQLMTGASTGNFAPDYPEYNWKMETIGWTDSLMREVIFVASYNVQGREHYVTLATLVAQE
jgi:type II secretory pathway pseudopilin PulG